MLPRPLRPAHTPAPLLLRSGSLAHLAAMLGGSGAAAADSAATPDADLAVVLSPAVAATVANLQARLGSVLMLVGSVRSCLHAQP